MEVSPHVVLIPDWPPLLQLHRQQQLEHLMLPFASLTIPDAVLSHLVRFSGAAGREIASWVSRCNITVISTRQFNNGQVNAALLNSPGNPQLVNQSLLEVMDEVETQGGLTKAIFLLEDHKCIESSLFPRMQHSLLVNLQAYETFLAQSQFSS